MVQDPCKFRYARSSKLSPGSFSTARPRSDRAINSIEYLSTAVNVPTRTSVRSITSKLLAYWLPGPPPGLHPILIFL